MTTTTSIEIHVKPRVLIADDSRIVRATLIKHIEGMFEFREALDGEQAWETLLVDPSIRVVITDLTMPRLDGYGLLQRIRNSKVARIRDIPVIIVSGSDEREERERAKAAGATDLITKGIVTAQLLSRLDVLSRLAVTQGEFERSLEAFARGRSPVAAATYHFDTPDTLYALAEALLANAVRNKRNFAILCIRVGLKHSRLDGIVACPPSDLVEAIGRLLRHTVRQTDRVALTGEAEFLLATGSINFDAARVYAKRVCQAIASANLIAHEQMSLIASCGVASLSDIGDDAGVAALDAMREAARRRAVLGLERATTGVVGREEERAFQHGANDCEALWLSSVDGEEIERQMRQSTAGADMHVDGARSNHVLQRAAGLSLDMAPIMELVSQQRKR